MDKTKLKKQIIIILLIIIGFILFDYGFYTIFTKNFVNNYGKSMQEKSINIEAYLPFKEDSLIVHESSDRKIIENVPVIDGATALYPVYSAYVEALYPKESVEFDGEVLVDEVLVNVLPELLFESLFVELSFESEASLLLSAPLTT